MAAKTYSNPNKSRKQLPYYRHLSSTCLQARLKNKNSSDINCNTARRLVNPKRDSPVFCKDFFLIELGAKNRYSIKHRVVNEVISSLKAGEIPSFIDFSSSFYMFAFIRMDRFQNGSCLQSGHGFLIY